MPPMSCQRDSDGNKSNVNGFPKVIIYKLRPDAWTRVLYVYNIFINNAVYRIRTAEVIPTLQKLLVKERLVSLTRTGIKVNFVLKKH